MSKKKPTNWSAWFAIVTQAYKYLLGIFVVLIAANGTGLITASCADPGQQAVDAGGFQATVCQIFGLMGQIVGGLAVIMIIVAGITYAASGGTDKGNVGIGSAKNMLMSAITGVVLFLLGGLIVGDCTAANTLNYGALLEGLLPKH